MNIYAAAVLFSFIILLYWIISELFTILFRFTGLPEERARFQVISLLTGCGFTTRESEIMLSSRSRRRIARVTMLFGYVFNITIVSALVNIFLTLKQTQVEDYFWGLLIPMAVIVLLFVIIRIPPVRAGIDHLLEKAISRLTRKEQDNSILILDYIGQDTIAQVVLKKVPEALENVPLSETGLKSEENILVMLVERGGMKAVPATGETVFLQKDKLTVFGDYRTLCRVFDASERFSEEPDE